ncbi:ATP-binding cassette domain-containing protein [Streptomyces sp. NBC_01013]|uniref:ATP-binding cassette domain-containing protein n=1 Tax=Streptomyces sp. NBC_01013 TaxID=2903718 RepID=UPI00386512EF|nr:ABC transporter ATP-binding protein [Streptomyces sp. NBC_01013]
MSERGTRARPSQATALGRVVREGGPFLRARVQVLLRLGGWSLLEFAQTFLSGYGVARALDQGFLAGHPSTGLLWLGVAALAVLPTGAATRRVFARLADLVEPFRDGLVRRAVARALTTAVERPADTTAGPVSQVTHQSEIARDSWAGLVLTLRSFVFTAAGALAGLAALAPGLLLIVLPPLVLGLALFLATLVPMAAAQRAYLGADEAFAAHAGQTASALRDIAAAGAAGRVAADTRKLAEQQAEAARSLARWAALRVLALAVCGRVPPLLLLLAAPWLMHRGLTGGALVGALTYLTQALAPAVHALMSMLGTAGGRLVVVLDRFTDPVKPPGEPAPAPGVGVARTGAPAPPHAVVAARAEPPAPAAAADPPTAPPGAAAAVPAPRTGAPAPPCPLPAADLVELRGVSFAYGPSAQPVLDHLDLVIRAGDRLAVVGPSGSGKSTLAAVLAGVVAPTRGEVRWHGRPTSAVDPRCVRTLLPQQAYVFSASLRDNLRYLRPDAPGRDLTAAVAALGLEPLCERLGGLDARVEPTRLTLGERQLIALGRAHVGTAPLLVLDEATSHLDPAAEARAETALAARAGTLVVIAHRLSSARRADRILVVDGSRTVLGTSAELLRSSALYRDLTGSWAPGPE